MKPHSIKQEITNRVLIGMFLLYLTAVGISGITINHWLVNEFEINLLSKANVIRAMLEQNADLLDSFEVIDEEIEQESEGNFENRYDNDYPQAILEDYAQLWEETAPYLDKSMPEFSNVGSNEYYQMWFKNGSVLSRSNSLGQADLTLIEVTSSFPQYLDIDLPDGRSGKAIQLSFSPVIDTLPISEFDTLGKEQITLILAQSTHYLDAVKSRVCYVLLVSLVTLLFISWWIIRYSLSKGMTPLKELHNQLAKIQENNFDKRIKLTTPVTELIIVEQQLNKLLIRLDASYQREKRFSSNVAHELRTPICEVRNIAEVALSFPSNNDDDQGAYEDVYQASLQMQDIVDNLLALARLERPSTVTSLHFINLYEAIENIKSQFKIQLKRKNIELDNRLQLDTSVFTSQSEIELILINLIDNALNYSPENSRIVIDASKQDDFLTINVTNTALNLEQNDLSLMFDRLWRKDKSRTGTNNSGIGLSLVKAYSDFLGLNVVLILSDEQQFTVKLSGLAVVNKK